jgi:hypothetical protein
MPGKVEFVNSLCVGRQHRSACELRQADLKHRIFEARRVSEYLKGRPIYQPVLSRLYTHACMYAHSTHAHRRRLYMITIDDLDRGDGCIRGPCGEWHGQGDKRARLQRAVPAPAQLSGDVQLRYVTCARASAPRVEERLWQSPSGRSADGEAWGRQRAGEGRWK